MAADTCACKRRSAHRGRTYLHVGLMHIAHTHPCPSRYPERRRFQAKTFKTVPGLQDMGCAEQQKFAGAALLCGTCKPCSAWRSARRARRRRLRRTCAAGGRGPPSSCRTRTAAPPRPPRAAARGALRRTPASANDVNSPTNRPQGDFETAVNVFADDDNTWVSGWIRGSCSDTEGRAASLRREETLSS